METIKQMRERHEKEIKELQDNCIHKILSDWVTEYWSMAHATGCQIKICNFCGKIVKKKGELL